MTGIQALCLFEVEDVCVIVDDSIDTSSSFWIMHHAVRLHSYVCLVADEGSLVAAKIHLWAQHDSHTKS